jgi:hypothetical protein
MDSIKKPLEELLLNFERLSKTQFEIIKLKSIKTAAIFASSLIRWITIFITLILTLIFIGIASALYIGNLYNNLILGFTIVAIAFLAIGFLSLAIMSKKSKKSIGKHLIKTILNS